MYQNFFSVRATSVVSIPLEPAASLNGFTRRQFFAVFGPPSDPRTKKNVPCVLPVRRPEAHTHFVQIVEGKFTTFLVRAELSTQCEIIRIYFLKNNY